eukprot:TRINITY_DN104780_c0_g1_i1.p1 TRINITY_DN104780_c0_g1~~TRINITY_DN104780_c0_g1_i1.p1  ORF type:complete len:327 (+),score=70.20 TRINITY_DN104780_c0_g1_i1:66-983(+)
MVEEEKLDEVAASKQITWEAFHNGITRLLNLTIEGYPRALRSTFARRNELLRKHSGDQAAAVEDVKAQAAAISEEAKSWLLGLVPYVGLPFAVLYPTWRLLRRVCLLAGVYGHDLDSEETRAKIVHVFGGLRAVPAGEFALEVAVQTAWTALAGPATKFIPVGTFVSKVANVEGTVMGIIGQETFSEGSQLVPEELYQELLDAEPAPGDYLALAKDTASYAFLSAWAAGTDVVTVPFNEERRTAAVAKAAEMGRDAASTARILGVGAVKAAPGIAAAGVKLGKEGASRGIELGKGLLSAISGTKK